MRSVIAMRLLAYLPGIVVGLAAVARFLPGGTVLGTGNLWVSPGGDLAENLTGHLGFQATGWNWPLLLAPNLAWPHGTSIAMTDSNVLVSLIAKQLAMALGTPNNLLGIWLVACWLLQPLAAIYALRGFGGRSWEGYFTAAVFAVLFPALLGRVGHINLLGHFLLLFALGMSVRMLDATALSPRAWFGPGLLLTIAALCHPYLFVFAAAIFATPVLRLLLDRQAGAGKSLAGFFVAIVVPVGIFAVLSGTLGGGGRGFGFYSMNLLSPIWPQSSGLFPAAPAVIDATGGQYEGFNYLGAGGLLLIMIAATVTLWHRSFNWRHWRALVIVLLGLTFLALSPRIYAGHMLVLPLSVRPWDQIFGLIPASGRAFWPVGYTLLLASITVIAVNFPPMIRRIVLTVALLLQVLDTAPLRASARNYLAGRDQRPPPIALPVGARWMTMVPVCTHTEAAAEAAGKLRLEAIRAGLWLRDMRASRLPHWFNCETALTDGLETPLLPREIRVFLEPPATTLFRQVALGADVDCRDVQTMVVCTRGLQPVAGPVSPAGAALPALDVPASQIHGQALEPLLSYGWQADAERVLWSEGPRATLLFRVPHARQSDTLELIFQLQGIARSADGSRIIRVTLGSAPPIDITLHDQESTSVVLHVPATSRPNDVVRVAFDIDHPVDPRTRGLAAPVGRAGVRLLTLSANWME